MPLRAWESVSRDTARQDREPETWQETVALRHPLPVAYAGALGRDHLAAMAPALIGTPRSPMTATADCRQLSSSDYVAVPISGGAIAPRSVSITADRLP